MRARLIFPEVEREPEGRPEECEGCGGVAFVRFGKAERGIGDIRVEKVQRHPSDCAGSPTSRNGPSR